MSLLTGKVAIVTGASTGMGRAIAVSLAHEGAKVAIVARSADKLQETATAMGGEPLVFSADVADEEAVARIVNDVLTKWGKVDILVNNAGTNTQHRNLADISLADWDKVLATNLRGTFLFTREVLPAMREQQNGWIVCISSGAGLQPGAPSGVAYSASKHAVHSLVGSINLEERRHGIRGCEIAPGEVDTPNLDLRPLPPTDADRSIMMLPEDIAAAVLYAVTQPERAAVELIVVTATKPRNYNADYERYVAAGHTSLRQG